MATTRKPKAVAAYARISRAGDTLGVDRQEELVRRDAAERGWPEPTLYVDNSKSAYTRGTKREGYEALLAGIQAGNYDAVLVYHVDRLFRQDRERLRFHDTCMDAGVHLIASVDGTDVLLNTADGAKEFRDRGSAAEYASARQSERLKRKHEELARLGAWSGGGVRPFGYTVVGGKQATGAPAELVINEAEARALRDAARRVLAGTSLHRVTVEWNEAGITTPTGKRWSLLNVRRVLLNPQVAGIREHYEWFYDSQGRRRRGELLSRTEGTWPRILTAAQHDLLVTKMTDPARRSKTGARSSARTYILTGGGLTVCGLCEQPMVGSRRVRNGRELRTYTCSTAVAGCGRVRISADHLEKLVLQYAFHTYGEWVAAGLDTNNAPPTDPTENEQRLLDRLQTAEAKLDTLAVQYATGELEMDPRRYNLAHSQLQSRIEELTEELAGVLKERERPSLPLAEQFEMAEDHDRRRAAGKLTPAEVQASHDWVASVIERVIIDPIPPERVGKRFDDSRVRVKARELPRPRRPRLKEAMA